MKHLGFVLALGLLCAAQVSAQKYQCVPDGFSATDKTVGGTPTTVRQALRKLKARCSHGVLKDKKNRAIKLVRQEGCWGNPPADYQEILEAHRVSVASLRKKYVVIEVSCADGEDIRKRV